MSNNLTLSDSPNLPYYVATYCGRSVAIKRDANYQNTTKLVQKSIVKLRGVDAQDILLSTTLADYGGALVQISEEIWPDVVDQVKTVEITLECDGDTASDSANVRAGRVTWTPRSENTAMTTTTTNHGVQGLQTSAASAQGSASLANTSTDLRGSLSITIRTPSQTLLELNDLCSSTEIKDVKSFIEDRYRMPVALQRLELLGKPLDDSMTLTRCDVTPATTMDLIVNARQSVIYLRPGPNQYGGGSSYQNVEVQFSLNRAWELAALRRPTESLPKNNVQSMSWNVDVAQDGGLTELGLGTKLSYLFRDGIAQPTKSTTPASYPSPSQPVEPAPTGRSQLINPLLDPQNSVAVPVFGVRDYIRDLFYNLGFDYNSSVYFTQFSLHLEQNPYKYLALRLAPQAECEILAPLSVSPPTKYIIRIFVLYKGLTAPAAGIWDNSQPNYAQGAAIWKDIAGIPRGGWGVAGGCLNVVEISWMELL